MKKAPGGCTGIDYAVLGNDVFVAAILDPMIHHSHDITISDGTW